MYARTFFSIPKICLFMGSVLVLGSVHAMHEPWQTEIGNKEYTRSCAACHGVSGKGDGPVAEVLSKSPPDLTRISQRNNGKFPTTRIYQLIDGEGTLGPHGSKEMPVWGDRYRADAIGKMAGVPHDLSPEVIAHGRILSLVYYLESIQK